ncbi:hypothetical protein ES703_69165 [subsurface metagenome]
MQCALNRNTPTAVWVHYNQTLSLHRIQLCCRKCGNKLFIVIDLRTTFPRLECSICHHPVGLFFSLLVPLEQVSNE